MQNPFLLFSLFWAEGDIDVLLDKFHQENQGHISSSLTASSVTKSASLDVGGAPTCTSEWREGAGDRVWAGEAASGNPWGYKEVMLEAHPEGRASP